jgi:hypothetical protein
MWNIPFIPPRRDERNLFVYSPEMRAQHISSSAAAKNTQQNLSKLDSCHVTRALGMPKGTRQAYRALGMLCMIVPSSYRVYSHESLITITRQSMRYVWIGPNMS